MKCWHLSTMSLAPLISASYSPIEPHAHLHLEITKTLCSIPNSSFLRQWAFIVSWLSKMNLPFLTAYQFYYGEIPQFHLSEFLSGQGFCPLSAEGKGIFGDYKRLSLLDHFFYHHVWFKNEYMAKIIDNWIISLWFWKL